MTFYEEYVEAQKINDSYRNIAKDRIVDFIRSGKSPFGEIHVSELIAPGENPADTYRIEFSIRPSAARNGEIYVWAYPLDGGHSRGEYISAEVINEPLV